MPTTDEVIQAGARVLLRAIVDIVQGDPHKWGSRPCASCQAVTQILGEPFGCIKYQRRSTVSGDPA